jgi:hypothetical protein
VVSELQLLYHLEEELKEGKAEVEEIYKRRQAIAMSSGVQGRWTRLMAYAQDGALLIDHHGIENQNIQRAAIIYFLLRTCKLHLMNLQEWLHNVCKKLSERKAYQMEDLLSQNWKVTTQDVV